MKIGCHISVEGGLHKSFERAAGLRCESFQIFTRNQRQWRQKDLSVQEKTLFCAERSAHGYVEAPICSHGSYLVNLCAADETIKEKSILAMVDEIERCKRLGIDYLIVHPGAHGGQGEVTGIALIAESLNRIREESDSEVVILLETVSEQGTGMGYHFAHFRDILGQCRYPDGIGICLDTCHMFASGYRVESIKGWEAVIAEIDTLCGWEKVKTCHLNDSLMPFGSRRDRHARLGKGMIGLECFRFMMTDKRFRDIPGILEVPGGYEAFDGDLEQLRYFRSHDGGAV